MDPITDNKDVAKKGGSGGLIAGIIIVLIVAVGGWYYFKSSAQPVGSYQVPVTTDTSTNTNTTTTTNTAPTLMVSTGQLFTSSANYSRSYEVYPTLDPVNGAKATSGFAIQKQDLGNGVTQITLVAKKGDYQTQAFVVGPGQKLYFVERSFGDDSNDNDANYGDDMGVVVDAQGYILR